MLICSAAIFAASQNSAAWADKPASSAPDSAINGGYQPPSVDELLHEDSTAGQLKNWHAQGEGGYAAEQIVRDTQLAHQLVMDSGSAGNLVAANAEIKKHRHTPVLLVGLLVAAGVLVSVTLILLAWSRFVQYRETRDVKPLAYQFPRV